MARLIKNTQKAILGIKLSTIFADSTTDRTFKTGDVVEGLRFVKDGEVITVSGRIAEIRYTMASRITFNRKNPADTLATDMKLENLVMDISQQYNSEFVTVPLREIVEFADETNVTRMMYEPFVIYEMDLKYSDLKEQHVSIEVGDIFDNVRIMNIISGKIGPDITGKFKVVGFAYAVQAGKIVINGIAFEDVATGEKQVADLGHILALNEVYTYELNEENIAETLANLADGDAIEIGNELDTTGAPIEIDGLEDITVALAANVIADNGNGSGIQVRNGSATISGDGLIVTETPYGSGHSSGVVSVAAGGKLTFNGSGISAVIEDDPVNKGQFGIVSYDDGELEINDGTFVAGWYCVTGNGSTTNADAVTTINGGEFVSVADYAIYHPHAGKLVINGGVIRGAAGAIAANNGVIEINGGELMVTGGGDTGNWNDGTSGLGDVAINLNGKYGPVTCTITGGTFSAAANTILIATGSKHPVTVTISGGKFTTKPDAAWIAKGFVCTDEPDAEGFYEVVAA